MKPRPNFIGLILLLGCFVGLARTSVVLAEDLTPRAAPAPGASQSAQATISATIIQPPDLSCSHALHAVTVEIVPLDNHPTPVPIQLRLDCLEIGRIFGVTHEEANAGINKRRRSPTVPLPITTTGGNPPSSRNDIGPTGHPHNMNVIYNFE